MQRFSKVLVTGGAGFIGSHVVEKLVKTQCEVSVIDNLFTGKVENLQPRFADDKVRFFKGDIRDEKLVNVLTRRVDAVVHLAAISSVPFSVENPVLTNEVNVNGTLNLLRACVNGDVERFVFISSCAVYGEPCYFPVDEEHPTMPQSPYAASKLAAEHYCKVFGIVYGLDTVILRPFNVYGSRQREENEYGSVVTRFASNLIYGKSLVIYGDGSQTRDFVHVEDVAEAVRLALENENAGGQTFNVGSGKATSIDELAGLFVKNFGEEAEIIYEKPRAGDLKQSYADIARAEKVLGYKPKTPLEHGLRSLMLKLKEKAAAEQNSQTLEKTG